MPPWPCGQPGRYCDSAGYRDADGGGGRTSRSLYNPADLSASPPDAGLLLTVPVRRHQRAVSPVSRWINRGPPLSAPLPCDLRLSLLLYPQPLWLALRFAVPCGRTTGLPRSAHLTEWVRSCHSAGGTTPAAEERRSPCPVHLPFWFKPVSSLRVRYKGTTSGLSNITAFATPHLGGPYHSFLAPDHIAAPVAGLAHTFHCQPEG